LEIRAGKRRKGEDVNGYGWEGERRDGKGRGEKGKEEAEGERA